MFQRLLCFLLILLPFSTQAMSEKWQQSALQEIPWIVEKYGKRIADASREFQISALLLTGILVTESLGDEDAVSHSGAVGLMQIKPGTLEYVKRKFPNTDFGDDLTDPSTSIRAAAAYLSAIKSTFGFETPEEWATAYSVGPKKAEGWSFSRRFNHSYAKRVFWVIAQDSVPVLLSPAHRLRQT